MSFNPAKVVAALHSNSIKEREFLEEIAIILKEEGLDAAIHDCGFNFPGYPLEIRIKQDDHIYIITMTYGKLNVSHSPKPINIPLEDPDVFKKVKQLCEQTWPKP